MKSSNQSSKRFQSMITACVLSVLQAPVTYADTGPIEAQGALAVSEDVPHTKDSLKLVKSRVEAETAALLDIREQAEWKAGHLKVAVFVPLSELKKSNPSKEVQKVLSSLNKNEPIYLHCRSGRRVLTATPLLKRMGFDVRPLKAGFDELRKNGFEVAKP